MLRVQIRDEQDRVLTEWFVSDDEDGHVVAENVVDEVAWLRSPVVKGGRTVAELIVDPRTDNGC